MNKILIIEDDEVQLKLQSTLLLDRGYTVYTTADGPQGVTLFKSYRPNLVLLDLGLPTMSGIEVLKEIKQIDPAAKVIVVTGYPSVESTVIAIRTGAWDYVQKPIDVEFLLTKIEAALNVVDG